LTKDEKKAGFAIKRGHPEIPCNWGEIIEGKWHKVKGTGDHNIESLRGGQIERGREKFRNGEKLVVLQRKWETMLTPVLHRYRKQGKG